MSRADTISSLCLGYPAPRQGVTKQRRKQSKTKKKQTHKTPERQCEKVLDLRVITALPEVSNDFSMSTAQFSHPAKPFPPSRRIPFPPADPADGQLSVIETAKSRHTVNLNLARVRLEILGWIFAFGLLAPRSQPEMSPLTS